MSTLRKIPPNHKPLIADGRLPKPHYLWGRAYWWLDELELHDEANIETYDEHMAQLREGMA